MTMRIEVIAPVVNGKPARREPYGWDKEACKWVFTCYAGPGTPGAMLALYSYSELRRGPTGAWTLKAGRLWTHRGMRFNGDKPGIPDAEVPVPLWVQREAARHLPIYFNRPLDMPLAEFEPGNGRLNPIG
jgi:hypothetical protein